MMASALPLTWSGQARRKVYTCSRRVWSPVSMPGTFSWAWSVVEATGAWAGAGTATL